MHHKKTGLLVLAGGLAVSALLIGTPVQAAPSAEMLANTCAGCHGFNGVAAGPAMPTIAGLPAPHTEKMLMEYKTEKRNSTIMTRIAKGYSDEEIKLIAEFFAKQKWGNAVSNPNSKMATPVDEKLAKEGKKLQDGKCSKCHEDGGRSQEDDVPRLAGQWVDYMLIKVEDYKNEKLHVPQPEKMQKQIDPKSLDELKAIAHFYASQK